MRVVEGTQPNRLHDVVHDNVWMDGVLAYDAAYSSDRARCIHIREAD